MVENLPVQFGALVSRQSIEVLLAFTNRGDMDRVLPGRLSRRETVGGVVLPLHTLEYPGHQIRCRAVAPSGWVGTSLPHVLLPRRGLRDRADRDPHFLGDLSHGRVWV